METLTTGPKPDNPFSDRELGQELERQAQASQLGRDLLRDFYQTFRLSQKETAIQPPLFTLLAKEHQLAGHRGLMAEAIELMDSQIDQLAPPSHHVSIPDEARDNPETGFRAMWIEYSNTLQSPDSGLHRDPEEILDDMLNQDLGYQDKERPNRAGNRDPHESIVREYILGDRLAGSDQIKIVRDHLRAVLSSPIPDSDKGGDRMKNRLQELIKSWEANHPRQSFLLQSQ